MIRLEFFLIGAWGSMLGIAAAAQEDPFPSLTGPYLGQKPPGLTPEVFAPGIITTNLHDDGSPIFSPDGREVHFRIITGTPAECGGMRMIHISGCM